MNKRLKILIAAGLLPALLLVLLPVAFPLSGEGRADWVTAIGRFHILFLHFPIALLLIVPVLELLGLIPAFRYIRQSIPVLLGLALLFAVKTCVLGFMLATGEGDSSGLLISHMWGGIITTILLSIAFLLRLLHSKPAFVCYLVILGLSVISLTMGSHNGAALVHGEDYLYAKLPAVFQPGNPEELITENATVYESFVVPIFKEHCFVCHSAAKQKGDFRMDTYELLLYGGESGMEGIAPGNLEDSEVLYRITLPTDKKAFMPPTGTAPLNADQIETLRWWIESGASSTLKISELSPEQIPEVLQQQLSDLLK